MNKPIKTYDSYEVVLVPFPFIDRSSNKKRPALVLSSSSHFNMKAGASVMAMITTATHHPWPLDIPIEDLKAAGLPVPSIRPLPKLHLFAKIALFGIFCAKFFDHVSSHALKILQKICTKSANFFKQSEFRKRSSEMH